MIFVIAKIMIDMQAYVKNTSHAKKKSKKLHKIICFQYQ